MKKYRPKNHFFEKMQNFRPSPNRSGTSLRGPGEFFEPTGALPWVILREAGVKPPKFCKKMATHSIIGLQNRTRHMSHETVESWGSYARPSWRSSMPSEGTAALRTSRWRTLYFSIFDLLEPSNVPEFGHFT